MAGPRSVVITGASRGLGLASAVHLHRSGWTVVAAMRSVDQGMARIREQAGAALGDSRLIGVPLDLTDHASIVQCAEHVEDAVGAPYALVHNAGISAAGMVEETPLEVWERMFATNIFGPVALTNALLPSMREAGTGRIVLVSSQAGVRGMPSTAAYSAVKGALERWGEAMAGEVSAFGIGVSVLVAGTYATDIITDAGTTDVRDFSGPYAAHHRTMDKRGRKAMEVAARDPGRFAEGLAQALDSTAPFVRRPVGPDARVMLAVGRILPSRLLHHLTRAMMGIPRHGALSSPSTSREGAPR